jgi:Ca-activated chloride channel family protein
MTGVGVNVDVDASGDGPATNRIYPKEVYDIFAGEQLVMVGRYKKHGGAKVTITGKVGGAERKFDFPGTLVEKSNDQSYAFVEKLWAMRRIGEIIDELDLKGKNDELINELVGLSTKHGILTPYTSFLADENAPAVRLADARFHLDFARREVDRLGQAEGLQGVAQRAEKRALQAADLPAQAASPAFGAGGLPAGEAAANGRGGGAPASTSGARVLNAYRDIDSDKEIVATGVQNAGKETLYKRGNRWYANNAKDVDPEKKDAKVKFITRFSDEYFALVRANTQDENAILAAQQEGEELVVRLRGEAYCIK